MKPLSAAWTWTCLVSALAWRLASETLWPWVRGGLALFGLVCIGCVCYVNHQYALHHPGYQATPPPSPVAVKLAAEIAPRVTEIAKEFQPVVIEHAGNLVARSATKLVYPVLLREVPTACEQGADVVLDTFGGMTMNDIASRVVEHQQAKGRVAHWTVRAAKEMGR